MRKLLIIIFFLLTFSGSLNAQFVDSGQDPGGIRWKQIQTENFQLIFPDFFEDQALRLAGVLEKSYEYAHRSLNHRPAKISVILHNYTTEANANVLWAPKRSNFDALPGQDIYPQIWLEQLALHEFRHVVQLDKMEQGVTRILYYIFGQQSTAAVFSAYIPFWLIEGDAVVTETLLSNTGRGRTPDFEMPLRAQLLSGRQFSYEKNYLGSYKDITAGYYPLGYFLVGYGRKKNGDRIWSDVFDRVARKPYDPVVFNRSLKQQIGKGKKSYYREVMQYLDSLWKSQESKLQLSDLKSVNIRKSSVPVNYLVPQYLDKDNWIVLKQGTGQIPVFTKVNRNGKEEKIFTPGFIQTGKYSLGGNRLAWCEFNPDVRWSNRLFSDIILYDLTTGKRKMLTRRRYLFSPDLSPDGKQLAAVEATPDYKFSLVIFDVNEGREIRRISMSGNPFLLTPDWDSKGESIAFIALERSGKALRTFNTVTGEIKEIFSPGPVQITLPEWVGDNIFFHGTYSGIDNIYCTDLNRKISKITQSHYGAFAPAISQDGCKLAFMDFSPKGFNLAEISIPEQLESVDLNKDFRIANVLIEGMRGKDTVQVKFDTVSTGYRASAYSKFRHLFYFHSWGPVSISTTDYSVAPALSLVSQNKLSTSFTNIALAYNRNEKTGNLSAGYTYKGWFPVISLTGSVGNRSRLSTKNERIVWNEKKTSLGIQIPLNFTSRKYQKGIRAMYTWNLNFIDQVTSYSKFREGMLNSFYYSLLLFRRHRVAERDLRTRWGQDLQIGFKHTPAGNFNYSSQLYSTARIYIPLFYRFHHNLMLTAAYQQDVIPGSYSFSNSISLPRGYSGVNNKSLWVWSADYAFPVAYPDFAAGSVIYIRRIYCNVFSDYSRGISPGKINKYNNAGFDLIGDVNFLTHILPFQIGFRYIRLFNTTQINTSPDKLQLIFRITL